MVLVHCYAGVSRSASVVIAYLMNQHGMSLKDAYQYVKNKRYFIKPNEGFRKQLVQFQRELVLKAKASITAEQKIH